MHINIINFNLFAHLSLFSYAYFFMLCREQQTQVGVLKKIDLNGLMISSMVHEKMNIIGNQVAL